jgi:hypothetical protein
VARHDEVGADEPAPRGEQPAQECGRDAEGRVGDHPEGPAGEPQIARVGLNDDDGVSGEAFL